MYGSMGVLAKLVNVQEKLERERERDEAMGKWNAVAYMKNRRIQAPSQFCIQFLWHLLIPHSGVTQHGPPTKNFTKLSNGTSKLRLSLYPIIMFVKKSAIWQAMKTIVKDVPDRYNNTSSMCTIETDY